MKKKILIVEDERLIGLILTKELEKNGYKVCSVLESGEEAVDFAQGEKLDAIIMDVFLNGTMDGIEAAGRIREQSTVPIIFLTCFHDDDLYKRVRELERSCILDKFENLGNIHTVIQSVVSTQAFS